MTASWVASALIFAAFGLAVLVLGLCAAAGRKRPVQYGPREMYGPTEWNNEALDRLLTAIDNVPPGLDTDPEWRLFPAPEFVDPEDEVAEAMAEFDVELPSVLAGRWDR